MRIDKRVEAVQWLILVATLALTAWAWPRVPERMPVHWNLAGQPDRYGGRVEGLLMLPLVAVGLYALFLVLPRFDPGRANYPQFGGAYAAIRTAILGVLAVIHGAVVAVAMGWRGDFGSLIAVVIGAMLAVLGAALPRVQPNWFVGIRTPWTLSSRRSWERTHRVGGRLFVAVGLVTAGLGLVRASWAFVVMMAGLLVGVTAVIAYSYVVWRDDPDKVPPAGVG